MEQLELVEPSNQIDCEVIDVLRKLKGSLHQRCLNVRSNLKRNRITCSFTLEYFNTFAFKNFNL